MDEYDDIPGEDETPQTPSTELAALAREAVEAQAGTPDSEGARRRCARVFELYTAGDIQSAQDLFHAAWVMLCGETQAHFRMARIFSRQATDLGEERAWTLRAMAWDRWLVATGKPQRFGTQLIRQGGRWSLGDVDPAINDYDRALFAVPPLFVQMQRAEQLQRQEER